MGIRGLTKYIRENREVRAAWDEFELKNTRVVIDGKGLLRKLYTTSGPRGRLPDLRHGGQYTDLYMRAVAFFEQLRTHDVETIVVIDGVQEGDAKLDEVRSRLAERLSAVNTFARSYSQEGLDEHLAVNVLPNWCEYVMQEAMVSCGVPVITADKESDTAIAALAHLWRCPVVSGDSDFFIFDLPGGLIHQDDLDVQSPAGRRVRRYVRSRFAKTVADNLRRLGARTSGEECERLLSLSAAMAGNDFTKELMKDHWRKFAADRRAGCVMLQDLLWLLKKGAHSSDEGLAIVLQQLPSSPPFSEAFRFSISFYEKISSPESRREVLGLLQMKTCLQPHADCQIAVFPDWLVKLFRLWAFNAHLIEVTQRSFPIKTKIILEDTSQREVISNVDVDLRRIMYGILLSAGKNPRKSMAVNEFARTPSGSGITTVEERALASLDGFGQLPLLSQIEAMSMTKSASHLRKLLLEALSSWGQVDHLPVGWQLPVATLRHWIKRTSNQVKERHLLVLLSLMINGCDADKRDDGPSYRSPLFERNQTNLESFMDRQERPSDHNLGEAAAWSPTASLSGRLQIALIHLFSQWQRIVLTATFLNSLLLFPFPSLKLHSMFDGVAAYQLFLDDSLSNSALMGKAANRDLLSKILSATTAGLLPSGGSGRY